MSCNCNNPTGIHYSRPYVQEPTVLYRRPFRGQATMFGGSVAEGENAVEEEYTEEYAEGEGESGGYGSNSAVPYALGVVAGFLFAKWMK